jgi:aspartate kinase
MNTLVMKFGGGSVGTTTALTQVLSIVMQEHERWKRLLLVVSALEGVTDALIEAAHLAQLGQRRGYRRIVATLRTRHLALIEHLPLGANERAALQADIDRLLFDMLDACQSLGEKPDDARPEKLDEIIGVGERLAARIVAALLRQNRLRGVAIDATDVLVTDNVYGNATPSIPLTRERIQQQLLPMLDRQIIPVLTGFIGATAAGTPTTLGRGGSDYTASILSVCTDASEIWFWTDVDGIMTADPRDFPDAKVIPALSYSEAAELAYFGGRVLHPRTVAPLRQGRIPLRVRNVFKPQQPGTLVSDASGGAALKAVTSTQGLGLVCERSGPLGDIAALVDSTLFTATGVRAEVMLSAQASEYSFVCFVIPTTAGPDALHTLRTALDERTAGGSVIAGWRVRPMSVLTLIGARLDEQPAVTAQVFGALDGVRLLALAQGRTSVTVVVESQDGERALAQLHRLIVG